MRFVAPLSFLKKCLLVFLVFSAVGIGAGPSFAKTPIRFADDTGRAFVFEESPRRVVCVVPAISEMIFSIGAGNAVVGVTWHNTYPREIVTKPVVGGYLKPSFEKIMALSPQVVFLGGVHGELKKRLEEKGVVCVRMNIDSLQDSIETLRLLGRIFGREKDASYIIEENLNLFSLIRKKVKSIPADQRKRVIRLMGREKVMTPGLGSFQNELIEKAGGIPPAFMAPGSIADVSLEDWKAFNPQVIYGCEGDKEVAEKWFHQPGWKDVDAVKNHQIFYFPCSLTCRAATKTGYFVSWLSARIYADAFSEKKHLVLKESVVRTRRMTIDLDYVADTRVVTSNIYDFEGKTLLVDFREPLSVFSTLEGERTGILTVGNHYMPPPNWGLGHVVSVDDLKKSVLQPLHKESAKTSLLFTGANMDNLCIKQASFKEMTVYALVTAGVCSNAVRMGKDTGNYYEPGTINIIIMTNMKLTPRAMARATISVTEGKTAALLDMDIRSTYQPMEYGATGTGTDNIIVVEGTGTPITSTGGHSKMGELIAKAVYDGVTEAVYKQNAILASRPVFRRLKERGISIYGLVNNRVCDCQLEPDAFAERIENILMDERFSGYISSALALSDAFEKGLVTDITFFKQVSGMVAEEMAETPIPDIRQMVDEDKYPVVLGIALNTLLNGAYYGLEE